MKILPIAAVGLGLAFVYNILNKPSAASESAGALGQTFFSIGSGLGSVGGGIEDFLTGIGTGSAKLLNPLFTLKTLFYGEDTPEVILQENQITASNATRIDPVVNTASDQPGVTPSAPASSTVTHSSPDGGFSQTTTSTTSGVTTSSPSSYTSRATGRATRFG